VNQPLATALRLARHPVNDLERLQIGGEIIPSLLPGENVDTGALRILADRVEWLERECEECRVQLHDVAAGRVDSRVRQERDTAQADTRALLDQVAKLTAERDTLHARVSRAEERANSAGLQSMALTKELAEARAENGRQAATIAAMRSTFRIESTATDREDRSFFRAWMEAKIDPASPHP
jgi:uncharacterized protein (UPF0335 family)